MMRAETARSAVHSLTWSPDFLTAVVDSSVFCWEVLTADVAVNSWDLTAARLARANRKL